MVDAVLRAPVGAAGLYTGLGVAAKSLARQRVAHSRLFTARKSVATVRSCGSGSSFLTGGSSFAALAKQPRQFLRTRRKTGRGPRCEDAAAAEAKFFPPMMTKPDWRWRLLAMATYTMPLCEGITFLGHTGRVGEFLMDLAMKANEVLILYGTFPLVPIAVFFFLFFKVIHNKKLPHFLRYHTLQSIMCEMAFSVRMFASALIPQWLFHNTFQEVNFALGVIVFLTSAWSCFFAARGMYGDIPFLSDAVYIQIPVGMDAVDPDARGEE